jgi:uncharacterized protein YbjT (DUF2867 family)
MRIVVTTPTGNIGSVVSDRLLKSDAEVVLLVRDPSKVESLRRRGAEVRQGSLTDQESVTGATRGADALFWLTPPTWVDDFLTLQQSTGRVGAAAAAENRIPRVVNLSSIGAHTPSGTGPVAGLGAIERMFDATVANVVHLRPASFMENFLAHAGSIRQAGSIYLPIEGQRKLPMVATRDIGEVAARWLLDQGWSGRHHAEIHGPLDLNHVEAAAAVSAGIERDVRYVQVSFEAARGAMLGMGMPAGSVEAILELHDGINRGLLEPAQPRSAETTTPTTLQEWSRQVLKPVIDQS